MSEMQAHQPCVVYRLHSYIEIYQITRLQKKNSQTKNTACSNPVCTAYGDGTNQTSVSTIAVLDQSMNFWRLSDKSAVYFGPPELIWAVFVAESVLRGFFENLLPILNRILEFVNFGDFTHLQAIALNQTVILDGNYAIHLQTVAAKGRIRQLQQANKSQAQQLNVQVWNIAMNQAGRMMNF